MIQPEDEGLLFDIIGDIHGYVDELRALLQKLGYRQGSSDGGAYRHPEGRQAIFVGDFIDRGVNNLETVAVVRAMVACGSGLAVMGNHEYNAILYHTPDPQRPGEFLRPQIAKNQKQHQTFLSEMALKPDEAEDALAWFRKLPVFLDFDSFRIIHACWHNSSIAAIKPLLSQDNVMSEELLLRSAREGSVEFNALEILLKGPELQLPDGMTFCDPDGHLRDHIRLQWWHSTAQNYRQAAHVQSERDLLLLPDIALEAGTMEQFMVVGSKIYIGHYWLSGSPKQLSPQVSSVDYSIAKGGKLCALRLGKKEAGGNAWFTVDRLSSGCRAEQRYR